MILAFYKGKGNLFDRIIRFWTRSKYSHVELVLPVKGRYSYRLWYSSSNWEGGVYVEKVQKRLEEHKNWDLIDISDLGFDEKSIEDWYNKNKGKKYDYLGLFRFAYNFLPSQKNKYFCSEAVMEMLGFEKPDTFTPASMYIIFNRLSNLKK